MEKVICKSLLIYDNGLITKEEKEELQRQTLRLIMNNLCIDDYIDEFCFNNEGEIEYGQLDIEKAFVNYVNNHHNGVKICIK